MEESEMSSKSTTKTVLWSFLEQGGSKVVSLFVQIALARLLSPEAFGIMAILLVVTNIADALAQGGLGSALIQRSKSDNATVSTAFWLSIAFALVLFFAILLLAPILEGFYGMPGLGIYLSVLSLVVLFNSVNSIQRSILQKAMDFKSLSVITICSAVVSGIVGVTAAFAGLGVWALVGQSLAQSVATCITMALKVSWRPTLIFRRQEARELFSYGWKIAATSILGVLYSGISDLVIGRACSATALGYYSQGRKYPMAVISMATNAIQNVMFPALALRQRDHDAFAQTMRRALQAGTFVIAPLSLFCAAAAEPIVTILLTEKWLPCVPIFQMVCISHSVLMLTSVNPRAYLALGRSDLFLRIQVVKVLIGGIAICSVAVITRDIYLTALATCISTLFNTLVIDPLFAQSTTGYSAFHQIKDIFPTVLLAVGAAGAAYGISFLVNNHVLLLAVQALVFCVIYFVVARALKIEGMREALNAFRSLVSKRKDRAER